MSVGDGVTCTIDAVSLRDGDGVTCTIEVSLIMDDGVTARMED